MEDMEEASIEALEEEEIESNVHDELVIDDEALWEVSSILDVKVDFDPSRPRHPPLPPVSQGCVEGATPHNLCDHN